MKIRYLLRAGIPEKVKEKAEEILPGSNLLAVGVQIREDSVWESLNLYLGKRGEKVYKIVARNVSGMFEDRSKLCTEAVRLAGDEEQLAQLVLDYKKTKCY